MMTRSQHWKLTALITSSMVCSAAVSADTVDTKVSDFKASMEKWVETEQLLSKESNEWTADKETLEAVADLLERERRALESEIAELEASKTQADYERRDLLVERGELQRGTRYVASQIAGLEAEVKKLVEPLPKPLIKKLEPLLVQIPEDPEFTRLSLGQRLINVLGVIGQADRFNSTATFVGETRSLDGDQKIQIRTLYWGLGQAIYVDTQGNVAGIGRPGDAGWTFTTDASLRSDAKLLLDIYEGNVDTIDFVEMPVVIQ